METYWQTSLSFFMLAIAGCGSGPAELSTQPSGGGAEVVRVARPRGPAPQAVSVSAAADPSPTFALPNDVVGRAVGGYFDAWNNLAGDAARAKIDETMNVIRERPGEAVALLQRTYRSLPERDGRAYYLAATVASMGIDEALDLLIEIANAPISEPPLERRIESSEHGAHDSVSATKAQTLTAAVAVDGIGRIARTGATPGKRGAAQNQLKSYFTHQYRFVRETAVTAFLRSGPNRAALEGTARPLLAAADHYMLSLRWERSPRTTTTPLPPAATAKPGAPANPLPPRL